MPNVSAMKMLNPFEIRLKETKKIRAPVVAKNQFSFHPERPAAKFLQIPGDETETGNRLMTHSW